MATQTRSFVQARGASARGPQLGGAIWRSVLSRNRPGYHQRWRCREVSRSAAPPPASVPADLIGEARVAVCMWQGTQLLDRPRNTGS